MDIVGAVAAYAANLKFEDIDPQAIEVARKSLLDITAVSIAAVRDPDFAILASLLAEWGGEPQCKVLGHDLRLPAPAAALANGALSRLLDFDDVVDTLGIHPSVAVFAPLLAIAQLRPGVSGREVLTAMAIGHDLCLRFAEARRETLLESGRYDLSKVMAAAAAAGRLFGLDEAKLRHAIGIAYTSALGEAQCMVDGAMSVFYQQGLVAANAVRAVLLAARGFTGASNPFTGRYGYYTAFEPGSDVTSVVAGLGQTFRGVDLAYKPFPTCRPNVGAIAVALDLQGRHRFAPSDVERIIVNTNQQIHDLVCAPVDQKRNPVSVVDARFSLPFNVAAALHDGDVFVDTFTASSVARPEVRLLANKVETFVLQTCSAPELGCLGKTQMEIELKSGKMLREEITFTKGHSRNPMTLEDVERKFLKCVDYAGTAAGDMDAARVCELVRQLESFDNMGGFLNALGG